MSSPSVLGREAPFRPRRGLAILAPVLYVAGAAAYAGEDRPLAWLGILGAGGIAFVGSRSVPDETPSEARRRVATWAALAIVIATSAWSSRAPWAACVREIASVVAGVFAARALDRIEGDVGLAPAAVAADTRAGITPRGLAWFAGAAVAISFGTAAIVDAAAWGGSAEMERAAPLVASGAGAISLFALGAAALVTASVRRLELAAPPRALACAATAGVALFVALALAIAGTLAADAASALATTTASIVVVRLARSPDPIALSRRGRRALTLLLFGGPVVTLAAISSGSAIAALVIAAIAAIVGAAAKKLEEPLLPVKGRLLDALDDATRAAHDRDAREAVARALLRLREAAGETAQPPELWMLHPTRIHAVDAAGYVREREGELPPLLLEIARDEPDRTIRVDVLRSLEVRRADLRPLLKWLEDRGALFATLVQGGDEPDGVVIAPAGTRTEPLTIEEVRAARGLADAFVAVCQARSALERHLAREQDLKARLDALDDELARVRHAVALDASRNVLASTRLARPATVGIYSAASRMAYDALERRIERDAPVVVAARAGVDPVPYIARAHLGGPRKEGPLVVVDGTSSREHDLERWRDERASPLALADRGLLVLVDGAALPRDIQLVVARALAERRPPWERATPLDVSIALTATAMPDELVEAGRLAPELFARFEDATPIELPGLRDRAEDLFSIVADRLAREGLRVRGKPIGIDAAAFARLVEHPFDGEDAELASIVSRLVARVRGDVVKAADLDALGLYGASGEIAADAQAGESTAPRSQEVKHR